MQNCLPVHILRDSCVVNWISLYEPAHEIMILITLATSEGSGGEPAHPRSLTRAIAVRTHEVWT